MRRFLLSFVRKNELFGTIPKKHLAVVTPGTMHLGGEPSEWKGINPVILDPAQDQAQVDLMPGGDITRVYVATDQRRLYIRINLWKPASRLVIYRIHLHPVNKSGIGTPRTYVIRGKRAPKNVDVNIVGRSVEIGIPWNPHRDGSGVMLSVDTMFRQYTLDRTAWTLLTDKKAYSSLTQERKAHDILVSAPFKTKQPVLAISTLKLTPPTAR
jgi:hypothetical protein